VIFDKSRDRYIPIEISHPTQSDECKTQSPCSVAFISAGYGVSHLNYQFIGNLFKKRDYMVVAIGHELPNDPPLSVSGNLYETRSENWSRGALTLDYISNNLKARFKNYDFDNLTLVGHSNGGDISAWLANEGKGYIQDIITLDHRRVPLPRRGDVKVLSIRASDFPADKGVLPTTSEQQKFGSCVVTIPKARHNDMEDEGPEWLKTKINALIAGFLEKNSCAQLASETNHADHL
jgi:pimeloyl-ACP methyl ester carboxylesterase